MKTNRPCTQLNFQPHWNWASTCKPGLMLFPTSLDVQDACVGMEGFSTFSSCYQTSLGSLSPHTYVVQSLSTGTNRLLDQRSLETVGHQAQGHFKSPTAILCPGFSLRVWPFDWKLSIRVPWPEHPQSLQLGQSAAFHHSQAVGAASAGVLEWLQTAFSCFRTQDASWIPSIDPGRCCSSSPFQINKIVPSAFHPQSGFLYIFIEC